MTGDTPFLSLPPAFQAQILPTPPDIVPRVYAEMLRSFCETEERIDAAYVCAFELDRVDAEPKRVLRFAVKLSSPVSEPGDSRDELHALALKLGKLHPDLMRELGCGMLADRALPVWEKNAVRVFAR